jgi:hypothetical protein
MGWHQPGIFVAYREWIIGAHMNEPALGERRPINHREGDFCDVARFNQGRVIWTIISLALLSFTLGILLCHAIQRSMLQQDFLFMWLWLLEVPLFFVAIVINTRRILYAIPRGQST